jgi:hypothetical protein
MASGKFLNLMTGVLTTRGLYKTIWNADCFIKTSSEEYQAAGSIQKQIAWKNDVSIRILIRDSLDG